MYKSGITVDAKVKVKFNAKSGTIWRLIPVGRLKRAGREGWWRGLISDTVLLKTLRNRRSRIWTVKDEDAVSGIGHVERRWA